MKHVKLTPDAQAFLMGIIFTVICIMFLYCAALFTGCSSGAKANIPERELEIDKRDMIIQAYGRLLHRVWIDRPSYTLDVLMETDEYIDLYDLLNGDFEDVFDLMTVEDSMNYAANVDAEAEGMIVHVVKHIVYEEAPSR